MGKLYPVEQVAAVLVALAQAGIPPDVQELLVHGNPQLGIAPGALAKALTLPPVKQSDDDEDPPCTDCGGSGITLQTERPCTCASAIRSLDITRMGGSD